MRGPELAPSEVVAYLSNQVERLEKLGLPRSLAVSAVAAEQHVAEYKVGALLDETSSALGEREVTHA